MAIIEEMLRSVYVARCGRTTKPQERLRRFVSSAPSLSVAYFAT